MEHIAEYDNAAEWCARRGLKGKPGDALPENMSSDGALKWIQDDPEAFQVRVREMAYGIAMENTNIDPNAATFDGFPKIWVAGAISEAGNGAFEWGLARDSVEAWRATWAAENAEMTEVRQVTLSDLGLSGECTADQVTNALDAHPELWEPEYEELSNHLKDTILAAGFSE